MLEIIALVILSRKIGNLAERKGLKRGMWRLYMILCWFGAEIFFAVAVMIFLPDEILIALGVAYAAAISSYFILKANLNKRPDAVIENEIDLIGQHSV